MAMIRQELLPYIEAAKLIAKAFGPDCEVIVHDLSVPQHSVVFVENNVVTGRHVGDSFGHLVQKARELGSEDGILANYYYRRDGRLIRSSSLLIRDNDGKLIGALCINVDSTALEQQIRSVMRQLPGYVDKAPSAEATVEQAAELVDENTAEPTLLDLVHKLIDSAASEALAHGPLTKERRLEVVQFLDSRQVFMMKGSVDRVAERLNVAKVTIYSDLDTLRGNRN